LLGHATDYDAAHGVLSITKARVCGIDKDVTRFGGAAPPFRSFRTLRLWVAALLDRQRLVPFTNSSALQRLLV
jgi:hypothetical protein